MIDFNDIDIEETNEPTYGVGDCFVNGDRKYGILQSEKIIITYKIWKITSSDIYFRYANSLYNNKISKWKFNDDIRRNIITLKRLNLK